MLGRLFSIVLLLSLFSCKRDHELGIAESLRAQFAQPNMFFPTDNSPTGVRIELGKYLFYNTALSIDSSISCSSCHQPKFAFSDNTILSFGANKQIASSNTPTLTNVGFQPYFLREGGIPNLEQQVLVPIQEHNEFNNNIIDIGERLKADTFFVNHAEKAYPTKPYFYVITRALASFERTFVSNQSKFDLFIRNKATLTKSEMEGFLLFKGNKANCIQCHNGFNFTNYLFENNGATYLLKDSGRFRLTKNSVDIGLFKIPTLKNVALTAPYMHDGSIQTLKQVLMSYNIGGNKNQYQNKQFIKPLNLTNQELENLEAFLNTLSDFQFVKDTKFKKHD